ncbi:MAG TPA: response regulator [Phycisphaerae bacterium]|nr:response regulator [Phycisphaerae bacterium]HPS52446.1 response regulator [Phycisphaerae bacterium]
MVLALKDNSAPLELVVTGEVASWLPALEQVVGPNWLKTRRVRSGHELLEVVRHGRADAAVLDDECDWDLDVLQMLRMLRQLDRSLQVVVVTHHTERQWMEAALKLAAYSVLTKPLGFEPLVRQIHGIMLKMHKQLNSQPTAIMKLDDWNKNW